MGLVALDEGSEDSEAPPAADRTLRLYRRSRRRRLPGYRGGDDQKRDVAAARAPADGRGRSGHRGAGRRRRALGVASLRAPLWRSAPLARSRRSTGERRSRTRCRAGRGLDPLAARDAAPRGGAKKSRKRSRRTRTPERNGFDRIGNPEILKRPGAKAAIEDVVLAAAKAATRKRCSPKSNRFAARSQSASEGKSGASQNSARRGRPVARERARRARGGSASSRRCAPQRPGSRFAVAKGPTTTQGARPEGGFPYRPLSGAARRDGDLCRRRLGILGHASSRRGQGRDRIAARGLLCSPRQRGADRVSRAGRRDRASPDAVDREGAAQLAGLPGGGGTPLASGLDAAVVLAEQVLRKGQSPLVVLMTDGRANVCRDGAGGRAQAMLDAIDAGRRLRGAKIRALAIDTSPPSAAARRRRRGTSRRRCKRDT